MEIKITKLNNLEFWPDGYAIVSAVHFKLDGEDYFLHYSDEEYEDHLALYKGRNKCHLTFVKSCCGNLRGMIRFVRKPGCLKYVDTEHFLKKLKEYRLL